MRTSCKLPVACFLCLGILSSLSVVSGELPKLTSKKPSDRKELAVCEGPCRKDSDCKSGLSCFKRSDRRKVPGCRGRGTSGRNYCYGGNQSRPSLTWSDRSAGLLGLCVGACTRNSHCEEGLLCFKRIGHTPIPGCEGEGKFGKGYCYSPEEGGETTGRPMLSWKDRSTGLLGLCQGACREDSHCEKGLRCFKRDDLRPVPGCEGEGRRGRDYCILDDEGGETTSGTTDRPELSWSDRSAGLLGLCQGACTKDSHCEEGLKCFKRDDLRPVPGCQGEGRRGRDYCILDEGGGITEVEEISTGVGGNVEQIKHIGTTRMYVTGSDVYKATIKIPDGTKAGDLLLLVIHRTDDFLPLALNDYDGWTRAAECYKSNNGRDCATYFDCKYCAPEKEVVGTKNLFCEKFNSDGQLGRKTDGSGKDLAQTFFYKEAGKEELTGSRELTIVSSPWEDRDHPLWGFMSTFRGADTKDPIRDWDGTGNDESTHSVCPSVYGRKGDLMICSQGFDSGAPGVREGDFLPPKGFDEYESMFDCDNPKSRESRSYKCDESGFLFGSILTKDGYTGQKTTEGNGRWEKSDSLLSLTIMPKGGSHDGRGRGASEWLGNEKGDDCPKEVRKRPKV